MANKHNFQVFYTEPVKENWKSIKIDLKETPTNYAYLGTDTLKEMEGTNKILTDTLESIDKKLYYIQYDKQSVKGFR
jgi:CRISPR/Cas system CSM-associated protein Csm2 small subunit